MILFGRLAAGSGFALEPESRGAGLGHGCGRRWQGVHGEPPEPQLGEDTPAPMGWLLLLCELGKHLLNTRRQKPLPLCS